ncbi:MAG TPA: hypothetical protein PL088_02415 [Spirochaetota bacterium]|nr:hypothetical protein [Spirochaetota bacterium]
MTFTRTIPSTPSSARQLVSEAMEYLAFLKESSYARSVTEFDFRLALDEAMEKALSHGKGNDQKKRI